LNRTAERQDNPVLDPTNQVLVDLVAQRFRALGDPARLRLLMTLMGGERTAGDLAVAAGLAQPAASKHLAVLKESGLVDCRRDGTRIHYRIADPDLDRMCALVCNGVQRHASRRRQEYDI
jgi:ArsR family transcriptional regulator